MSDLTVLVSPTSVYPNRSHSLTNLRFKARPSLRDHPQKPVMVVLESVDESDEPPSSPVQVRATNASFLSPPKNTFRAPSMRSPSDLASSLPSASSPRTFNDMGIFTHAVPRRSFFSFKAVVQNRSTELRKPPPLLFRPNAFWKKTRRSGVTSAAYSPSSFLVRRSTFIAAGLSQDKPGFDSSALGVESRVKVLMLGPDHDI
ncbi:hypothetical protein EDD17DRAFT_1757154 [Pisolithus thermaeus]|nr:hypothetical protein EV401DRAFT_2141622 [Pisolithus croceorrhizus]KAI6162753.1 hypothetical protein EDD17DRAFT_1757154 [Pisolithus thermaeus]